MFFYIFGIFVNDDLQYLKELIFVVDYFVIGVGVIVDYDISNKDKVFEGSLLFFWVDYFRGGGFVEVQVVVNNMMVEMMDCYGIFFYKIQFFFCLQVIW